MVRLNTPEATRLPGSASPPPPTEQPSRKGQPGPACCRCGSAAGMCRAPRRSSPGPRGSRPPPRAAATPLPRFTFLRDGGVRGAQWRTRSTQQATCHTKHAATGFQCPFFASHRSPPPPVSQVGWGQDGKVQSTTQTVHVLAQRSTQPCDGQERTETVTVVNLTATREEEQETRHGNCSFCRKLLDN